MSPLVSGVFHLANDFFEVQPCWWTYQLILSSVPLLIDVLILLVHLNCFQLEAIFSICLSQITMNICIQLFVGIYIFISLGLIPMSGITGSYDRCMFNLKKKKLPNYSSKYLFHFTFLPAIYEGSCFSTSSLTLGIVSLLYYSLSNDCAVVAQCIFLIINDAGHN